MKVTLTHGCIIAKQTPEQRAEHKGNFGKKGESYDLPDDDAKSLIALGMATKGGK